MLCAMQRLASLFVFAALLLPLAACSSGETEGTAGDGTAASTATETGAEATTTTGEAEAICCGGGCDAPAGYCCQDDGTCGGNHEKLPVWQP